VHPLDPYKALRTSKPLKRGKSIRLPTSLSKKPPKTAKPLPPTEQYVVWEFTDRLYNPSSMTWQLWGSCEGEIGIRKRE